MFPLMDYLVPGCCWLRGVDGLTQQGCEDRALGAALWEPAELTCCPGTTLPQQAAAGGDERTLTPSTHASRPQPRAPSAAPGGAPPTGGAGVMVPAAPLHVALPCPGHAAAWGEPFRL